MADDADIKRFIQAVKTEADKEEDFVLARVEETYPTLWNLMKSRYANFDDLCEKALKKASIYGQMEDLVRKIDKQTAHITIRETVKTRGDRIATIVSWNDKELYTKFCWRYSRDELKKIAVALANKKTIIEKDDILL